MLIIYTSLLEGEYEASVYNGRFSFRFPLYFHLSLRHAKRGRVSEVAVDEVFVVPSVIGQVEEGKAAVKALRISPSLKLSLRVACPREVSAHQKNIRKHFYVCVYFCTRCEVSFWSFIIFVC